MGGRFAGTLALALALVVSASAYPALAQEAPAAPPRAAPETAPRGETPVRAPAAAPPQPGPQATIHRLPAEKRTKHTLVLPGRTLSFTAVVGALPVANANGRVLAEIAYVAYLLDTPDPKSRPVAFAFNGGPGSASTWLHLGGLGPWRLPLTPALARPSANPELLPNAETWLDAADLVFIDPVGTGYSAIVNEPATPGQSAGGSAAQAGGQGGNRSGGSREEGGPRWFFSVNGDVESLADFIQHWLKGNDRLASPKMIVGESYGGFRAPRIAHTLQRHRGVGVSAMVLVSPVIDFDSRRGGHQPLYYANLLPSIAASAMERRGDPPSRAVLSGVEDYARGDFLMDLMRGPRNAAAVDRITRRVAELSGLPVETVARHGGRLGGSSYIREVYGPDRRIASLYDASMTGFDPYPTAPNSRFDDPFTTGLAAPMTSAMIELYERLGWRVDREYHMLSSEVNRAWVWGNSPSAPESLSSLREALALDPKLRVLVTHGFTDLVTPYLASAVVLDQLPAFGDAARVQLKVYPSGHMHYSRDVSRSDFKRDAEALLAPPPQPPVR